MAAGWAGSLRTRARVTETSPRPISMSARTPVSCAGSRPRPPKAGSRWTPEAFVSRPRRRSRSRYPLAGQVPSSTSSRRPESPPAQRAHVAVPDRSHPLIGHRDDNGSLGAGPEGGVGHGGGPELRAGLQGGQSTEPAAVRLGEAVDEFRTLPML